ncbi:MAG: LysM peptidoglycan-binding domain-containing protein [Planctomycetota bacterium]|nr:LysM peptidoglycan-binding domain-containing protein [Planctomycetota bacterium]MDA1212917.1 LysM peptidoglycan-binding domain-containing protein [Planctomycetota bacterium]
MSLGTKIGLLLVAVLCGIGGYFVYQNIKNNTVIVEAPPPDESNETPVDDGNPGDGHKHDRHSHRHAKSDVDDFDPAVELAGAVTEAPSPQNHDHSRHGRRGNGKFDFDDDLTTDESGVPQGQTEPDSDPFEQLESEHRGHRHHHKSSKPEIVTLEDDLEDVGTADKSDLDDWADDDFTPRYGRRGGKFDRKSASLDEKGNPIVDAPKPLPRDRNNGSSSPNAGQASTGFDDFTVEEGRDTSADELLNDVKPSGQADNRWGGDKWNNDRWKKDQWDRDAASVSLDNDAPEALDDEILDSVPSHHHHSTAHSPTTSPGDVRRFPHEGHRDHDHGQHHGLMKDMQVYVVEQNDSFWSIAKKVYGAGSYFNALAAFNQERIPDPQKMRPGMKVFVPPKQELERQFPQLIATLSSTAPVQQSGFSTTVHGGHHHQGDRVQPAGFFVSPQGQPSYRIGKSDTLSDIAKTHLGRASRWSQIYELNRQVLQTPHSLQVGLVLQLPADASSVALVKDGYSTR